MPIRIKNFQSEDQKNDSFKKNSGKKLIPARRSIFQFLKKTKKIEVDNRDYIFDFFVKFGHTGSPTSQLCPPNGHLLSHHLVGISCKPSSPKG